MKAPISKKKVYLLKEMCNHSFVALSNNKNSKEEFTYGPFIHLNLPNETLAQDVESAQSH